MLAERYSECACECVPGTDRIYNLEGGVFLEADRWHVKLIQTSLSVIRQRVETCAGRILCLLLLSVG